MEKGTSEIAKLTERISKDPKSKLFVPLAEEYKKAGDIEMAIAVLTEGLKNNPGYVTAKSFLGRLLLDKGDLKEAQNEFEEVIKAIPDNVLAQRKLADIHVLQGRPQEALIFFKAVLAVNPKDPELKALVADIEAGRDVRERIAGPKGQPEAGHAAAVVPTPVPPRPAAAPVLPVKPPETPVVPPRTQTAPVSLSPSRDAEEPEEVLVFESLDEAAAPAGTLQQPEATQDMFAELASETVFEEEARTDDAVKAGEDSSLFDEELPAQQPMPDTEAGTIPSPDRPAASVAEGEYGSTDTVPGASFFDSEPAPIDIPAQDSAGFDAVAAPELPAPVTEHEFGSTDKGPGTSFFDSEPTPIDIAAQDSVGFDAAAAPVLSAPVTEHEFGSTNAGVSDSDFFDVEPVETEAEPLALKDGESGEEPMQVTLDVPAPGPDIAADNETVAFGEMLPEADDFTTDTLAELYIAQGFYEKAIEIYERMLADRPNSRLLKDKLDNVRAMGSASNAGEEQGTPLFFEAPGSPPPPSSQPKSAGSAGLGKGPGLEREAKEYAPPPADDFASTAFDSGFAPVEYVLPEAPPSAEHELPVQDEVLYPVSPKTAASGKEQVIGKLDNWLKNIMKEK